MSNPHLSVCKGGLFWAHFGREIACGEESELGEPSEEVVSDNEYKTDDSLCNSTKVVVSIDFGSFGFASAYRFCEDEEEGDIRWPDPESPRYRDLYPENSKCLAALLLQKPVDSNFLRSRRPQSLAAADEAENEKERLEKVYGTIEELEKQYGKLASHTPFLPPHISLQVKTHRFWVGCGG